MAKQQNLNSLIETLQEKLKTADPRESVELTRQIISLMDRLPDSGEKLWTVEEVSEFLNLKVDTVRKWTAQEHLPVIKLGGA